MIFFYLVAALAALFTFAFGILPDGATFIPLPDVVYTAVGTVGGWIGWGIGIFGAAVRTALLTCIGVWVVLQIAFFLIDILRFFKFPIVNKLLK